MVKNYASFYVLVCVLATVQLQGQEIRIFSKTDFDLIGKVKSCLVSTKYGKEEYDFNKEGFLTKSVTRYNDADYDITYYKYDAGHLMEKRFENYQDNTFNSKTSFANFYDIDTTSYKKITEKIISYDKEFLDQYEHIYDKDGRLVKIIRTNNDGTDETVIEYSAYKGEQTTTYKLNGTLYKSIRTSTKKAKDKSVLNVMLTKRFLEGQPITATEEIRDAEDRLISKTEFFHNPKTKQFSPEEVTTYTYDAKGMLSKTDTKRGEVEELKEYIYQFDGGDSGNWVKQIIIPDNAYTTRSISYFEIEKEIKEEK